MSDRVRLLLGLLAALAAVAPAGAAHAAEPLSARESFRIGSGTGSVCTAQALVADAAFSDMFDRGYAIVCRDAAIPVGKVYALRIRAGDPAPRLAAARARTALCAGTATAAVEGLGPIETLECRLADADLAYRVYAFRRGGTLFVSEGLAGYDSALQLALRSVVADREVAGEVSVATTGAGDPAAFARAQAGTLDRERALAEAYRRNNAGSYAEAAEFFTQLGARDQGPAARAEALVNEAIQKSNLGAFGEADLLFLRAEQMAGSEPVIARRLRNYRAMHLLNQGRTEAALVELDRPVPAIGGGSLADLVIDRATAIRLTAESLGATRLGGVEGLTPGDKARILDGQALQLRGTVFRLLGRNAEAVAPLTRALDELIAIRGGRVAATRWMRAQIFAELASLAEERGDSAGAERFHREGIVLLETNYPGSAILLAARGRLAGFLGRGGGDAEALALYRGIVEALSQGAENSPALRAVLEPYFAMLAGRASDPAAVADLFLASQLLVRPGVAQTQAVLARELSGGSDEASRLFRQAVNLTRDIERHRVEIARIEAGEVTSDPARATALRAELADLQQAQVAAQARLADFPRYRAVSGGAMTLADLQALLAPGEAYYKMLIAGGAAYGLFATRDFATAFPLAATPAALGRDVDALRSTISVVENGQQLTYPFDLALARRLYGQLFAPVAAQLEPVRHLIFEPDGPLLRLPVNLLVMDDASVEAYRARAARPGDDGFDFRGVAWLGRDRDISTAVSAPAFRDVRRAAPSRAPEQYIGFGQNAPVEPARLAAAGECTWPAALWSQPIAPDELHTASAVLGARTSGDTEVVTGAAFTDTAIGSRDDLHRFRIVHFATHGLVTGPRPECPARPALVTSFGGEGSDGLLTFAEIFDLRMDADLILLSACDTAGQASRAASAEAGLASSGEFSLDGLVRAFIGAGGRLVVASHWPVPDDFEATERLIGGVFAADPGVGTAAALRAAQRRLMDQADTSHPYYWSAFAVVGDGAVPVIRAGAAAAGGED